MASHVEEFLTEAEEQRIVEAIRDAEMATSGEIRVHIERTSPIDSLARAKEVFYFLKMENTKDKNGVLFYVAVDDKKFAIIGDEGINKVVPKNFWESVTHTVTSEFAKGKRVEGLVLGILDAGQKLQQYFPYQKEDKNELSDQISKG
jgi:uncharacterized membrane protein